MGGLTRVVIVKEDHDWYPFFSTDPNATAVEIIEAFADRRKALRQHIMQTELSILADAWRLPRKILRLFQHLVAIAA